MIDPRRLITAILNKELKDRQIALSIEKAFGENGTSLQDYEDDVKNIQKAIKLWESVKP